MDPVLEQVFSRIKSKLKSPKNSGRLESFVDLLNYDTFEDGIFLNDDGSVGMAWIIKPLPITFLSQEAVEQKVLPLKSLFQELDEGISIQFILDCSQDVKSEFQEYQRYSKIKDDPLFDYLQAREMERLEEFRSGIVLPGINKNLHTKTLRILVTILHEPNWVQPNLLDKFQDFFVGGDVPIEEACFKRFMENKESIFSLIKKNGDIVFTALKDVGFEVETVSPKKLIGILQEEFNAGESLNDLEIEKRLKDPQFRVKDLVCFHEPEAIVGGFKFGDKKKICFGVMALPHTVYPGLFTNNLDVHSDERIEPPCFLDSLGQVKICVNIFIGNQNNEKSALRWKRFGIAQKSSQQSVLNESRFNENIQNHIEDVLEISDQTGERILRVRTTLVFTADKDTENYEIKNKIFSAFSKIKAVPIYEEHIGHNEYLRTLPFMYSKSVEKLHHRHPHKLFSGAVAEYLPIYGSARGSKTAHNILINRRGEIARFSHFDSPESYNGVIIGSSGSGKSFLTQNLIRNYLRAGIKTYVIDLNPKEERETYRRFGEVIQEQSPNIKVGYYNFNMNKPICINIFKYIINHEGKPEKEVLVQVKNWINTLVSGGDKSEALTREQAGIVSEALMQTVNKHGEKSCFSAFLEELRKFPGHEPIYNKLRMYKKGGIYGEFIDGDTSIDIFEDDFSIFQIAPISRDRDIIAPVVMSILELIRKDINDPRLIGVKKYINVDEAWKPLSEDVLAEYFKEDNKTIRKADGSLNIITQDVDDLLKSPAAKAILTNIPIKIFLKLEGDPAKRIIEMFDFTEKQRDLFRTLRVYKGLMSEGFFMTPMFTEVLAYPASSIMYWLSTSDDENAKDIMQSKAAHQGKLWPALLKLDQERVSLKTKIQYPKQRGEK